MGTMWFVVPIWFVLPIKQRKGSFPLHAPVYRCSRIPHPAAHGNNKKKYPPQKKIMLPCIRSGLS